MSTNPTPHPHNPHASNTTSGDPPWYPPNYPEWLVSESCLLVIFGIMAGNTLTKVHETVTAGFRERVAEAVIDRTKLTPGLIREMALAINPGATEEGIRLFLGGIVETFVLHQADDLTKIKRFLSEYPEFQARAELKNSAEAAEVDRALLGILREATQAAGAEAPETDS